MTVKIFCELIRLASTNCINKHCSVKGDEFPCHLTLGVEDILNREPPSHSPTPSWFCTFQETEKRSGAQGLASIVCLLISFLASHNLFLARPPQPTLAFSWSSQEGIQFILAVTRGCITFCLVRYIRPTTAVIPLNTVICKLNYSLFCVYKTCFFVLPILKGPIHSL